MGKYWPFYYRCEYCGNKIRAIANRCNDCGKSWLDKYKGKNMSTNDVPGANNVNNDILKAGCWAEHADGSLLYVKGTENNQVVYELYDLGQSPIVFYQDAMREDDFKKTFSYPPIGKSQIKWTWHDKTPFPWDRIMKNFNKPIPIHANVEDHLSAAEKVAESLKLKAKKILSEDIELKTEQIRAKTRPLFERLEKAFNAFME